MPRRLLTAALALLATSPALAERPLTYNEALQAAEAANPQLTSQKLSVEQAATSVMGAWAPYDPQLNLSGTWSPGRSFVNFGPQQLVASGYNLNGSASLSGSFQTGTSYSLSTRSSVTNQDFYSPEDRDLETKLGEFVNSQASLNANVSHPLLKGHRMAWQLQNVTQAKHSLSVAELQLERQRQETMASAASAYWSWAYQVRLKEIADESVAIAEENLRIGQLKVQAGELAPVEKTRLEAALVQAKSSALDAANAERSAADQLLLLMGEAPGQELLPATQAEDPTAIEIDPGKASTVALEQNLDVAVAEAELERARSDLSLARHGLLPSLSATGSFSTQAVADNLPDAYGGLAGDGTFPSYSLGVEYSMPLGNRSARAERDRTAVTLRQRELSLQETERSVTSQVQAQVRSLNSARQRVELADANLRLAEQTLASEEALAASGRAIQKDVLEARNEVDRAKAEAAKARTDYQIAVIELKKLQGQL